MSVKAAIALIFTGLLAAPTASLAAVAVKKVAPSTSESAYYSGDVQRALSLAPAQGQRWIAGLAAYRLGRFPDAEKYFRALTADTGQTPDLRAAAAFWGARSAAMQANAANAEAQLATAAKWPTTFYGMIAARHEALLAAAPPFVPDPTGRFITFTTGDVDVPIAPQAMFTQAVATTSVHANALPVPVLKPLGGFTIYPGLVYALVKQESAYNPYAVSSAGALGLMQLMPATARQTVGSGSLSMSTLMDGPTNMRIGQDYFASLVNGGLETSDMLCAVAAYNGGPGTVRKVADAIGGYGDSLMIMELMPARETRDYVEKVMTNYWTFQHQFGFQTPTLDHLAGGESQIDIHLDELQS